MTDSIQVLTDGMETAVVADGVGVAAMVVRAVGVSGMDCDLLDLVILLGRSVWVAFTVPFTGLMRVKWVLIYSSLRAVEVSCASWQLLLLSL